MWSICLVPYLVSRVSNNTNIISVIFKLRVREYTEKILYYLGARGIVI